MSYSSTNGTFVYTITNNTNYVIEQLDYDIILSTFNRWESLITIDSRFGSSYTITISYIIDTLDAGVLGGASITNSSYVDTYVYGNVVPLTANITMNNTYLQGMKTTVRNDGYTSYYHVLLHEIGHILGIGSFWYLTGCPKTSYDDNGTTKYYYTGTNAFREYKLHFGNNTFVGVPIEDDGGAGTSGVHPEEGPEGGVSSDNRYINGILHPGLDTELMTGWLDGSPVSTPLSRITLGFLEDMGYTVNYNLADVYIMSWLQETEANNLERTYIQGFLDVSGGNIINRNGNLSILQGTMDVSGAVAFNSRLDVGGDVSLNGDLTVAGDFNAQYPDNSIPAAAIDGQVEATPNFSGDVDFQSNVDISDNLTVRNKVAIGKTTLGTEALDVSGNINFSGSLYNDGVAYVSGATDLDGLSDVIVGGAEFTDSLLIGSTNPGTQFDYAIRNVGIGIGVLNNLTTGRSNVAVGYSALYDNSGGDQNTAIGERTLFKNQTGNNNTAVGTYALHLNQTGNGNTADGYAALYENTTGTNNTANGSLAGNQNKEGNNNTYNGYYSGYENTTGDNNTCIGYYSGNVNTTGDNNTYIGAYADAVVGETDLSYSTAIGYKAKVTASNQIMLGTADETVVAPGQVDICGNLYAQYDIVTPTIPAGAIIGGVGSNVFDSGDVSMNSSLVVGGNTTVNGSLNTGFIALGGHIHPTTNAAYDLGNAEYKIRHCFLSDNSLWVGDDHKVDVSGGKMKFKKRKKDTVPASIAAAGGNAESAKSLFGAGSLSELTLKDWIAYAKSLDVTVGGTATTEISIQDIYGNSNDADYEIIQNADIVDSDLPLKHHLTINPIDVTVNVSGIQHLDQSLKFTIPNSMTALKYFCTSHPAMIGDFTLASLSTETDKTYYVRMVDTDPQNTAPYYLFSDAPNGTALNDASTQLTLYKGNTYTFITTATTGHPFMVGDSHNVTTGMKLESTGDGAVTESKYTNPYPLHVNGMANIENNLNVARTLTVSGPIRQW